MSLFVRLDVGFYSNRKTVRLISLIGNDALWIPPRLWAYAAGNQPDGVLNDYTASEIAIAIGYQGDAQALLQALLQAGFLDSNPLRIHDWHEHQRYHVTHATFKERAKKAAAARWEKDRNKNIEKRGEETEKGSIATSIASSMSNGKDHSSLLLKLEVPEPETDEDAMVDEVYELYPRKVNPSEAKNAIRKAIKKHGSILVRKATEEYGKLVQRLLPDKSNRKFVPHPATWFNQGGFLTDPAEWEITLGVTKAQAPTNTRNNGVTNDIAKQASDTVKAVARMQELFRKKEDK